MKKPVSDDATNECHAKVLLTQEQFKKKQNKGKLMLAYEKQVLLK